MRKILEKIPLKRRNICDNVDEIIQCAVDNENGVGLKYVNGEKIFFRKPLVLKACL